MHELPDLSIKSLFIITKCNFLQDRFTYGLTKKERTVPATDTSALSDIQEVNLSYLMLAQRLLRENYAAGMYRLGFDSDVADIILGLSPAQLVKLASSNTLICGFRLNDYELLSTLGQDVLGGVLQQAHSTILLAQRGPEQFA